MYAARLTSRVARALSAASDGVALLVEVVPGASEDRFPAGYNPWRQRIQARVSAPPAEGKANAALCRTIGEFLGIPAMRVTITSGHTSRQKTVHIAGLTLDEARERLRGVLPE